MHSITNLGIYFVVISILTFVMILLCYVFGQIKPNTEKLSAYECGFQPFASIYLPIDVHFYRIAMLFLIFDIEILFLFPWCLNFNYIHGYGHLSVFFFIFILLFGFIVEWRKGALYWS